MKILLITLLIATAFNTGLIWIIQLVHYPGFLKVGVEGYKSYHGYHTQSITWIVAPSMLIELLCSGVALFYWKELPSGMLYLIAVLLLVIIWINTAFWAIPIHGKLASGYDALIIKKLVNLNWWRTIAWSGRSLIIGWIVSQI